ncbi:MAG: DNA/RNA non-specific endonuclease [Agriterribacter sp.]
MTFGSRVPNLSKVRNPIQHGYQQSVKCNTAKGGTSGTDQGGHLFGSRFDGAGEQINLVPMNSTLNLSQWKIMENNWENLLKQNPPKVIKIKIEIKYEDATKPLRPTRFLVTETIDGVNQPIKTFIN